MRSPRAIAATLLLLLARPASASFLEEFADLKKLTPPEPRSSFYFAFGLSPVAISQNSTSVMFDAFELHWLSRFVDFELLSGSVGFSLIADTDFAASRRFLARSSPKLRVLEFLSVGPLVGYEFVTFPNVPTRLTQGGLQTPYAEPFSSSGVLYGMQVSETFHYGDSYLIKVSQSFYKQTYSTTKTSNGWNYQFDIPALAADPDRKAIRASYVIMMDVSLLF